MYAFIEVKFGKRRLKSPCGLNFFKLVMVFAGSFLTCITARLTVFLYGHTRFCCMKDILAEKRSLSASSLSCIIIMSLQLSQFSAMPLPVVCMSQR